MRDAPPAPRAWWGLVLLVTAATILGHQLILPPIVGLADNGDYSISPNGSDPSEKQVRGAIGYPAAGLDKLGTFARPPH